MQCVNKNREREKEKAVTENFTIKKKEVVDRITFTLPLDYIVLLYYYYYYYTHVLFTMIIITTMKQ